MEFLQMEIPDFDRFMGIIFAILKIIGIVLLVIAALIAVILFVPVTYEADGDSRKKKAHIKVGWLLGFLRFQFLYQEGSSDYALHILWFHVLPREHTGRKRKSHRNFLKRKKAKYKEAEFFSGDSDEKSTEREKGEDEALFTERPDKGPGSTFSGSMEKDHPDEYRSDSIHVSPPPEEAAEKTGAHASGGKAFRLPMKQKKEKKNRSFFSRKKKRNRTGGRHRSGNGKLSSVRRIFEIFQKYREKELFGRLFRCLMKFLMHIRPRKVIGNIRFGLSDPALTGRILGAVAMIPFLYQIDLKIEPDFDTEKAYMQGNGYLKGHIQLIFLLIFILQMISNKDFRSFLSEVRNR